MTALSLNSTLDAPGSSSTARVAAVPDSTMEVAAAMATTLPASRIVRQNVSTQEGNDPVSPFAIPIVILGQADKKTQTPALSPWTGGLAGP